MKRLLTGSVVLPLALIAAQGAMLSVAGTALSQQFNAPTSRPVGNPTTADLLKVDNHRMQLEVQQLTDQLRAVKAELVKTKTQLAKDEAQLNKGKTQQARKAGDGPRIGDSKEDSEAMMKAAGYRMTHVARNETAIVETWERDRPIMGDMGVPVGFGEPDVSDLTFVDGKMVAFDK